MPGRTAIQRRSTPLNAAVKRLAAIDDQLAGLATPGNDVAGDARITPELAERLDTLLLLRMVAAGIHPDLVAVCSTCLAKRQGERYPSAAELGVDLSRFLEGRPRRRP